MSTKEEASPSRKTEKCMCNKNFLDNKELIPEEYSEEDIEEMANSLADLKVEEGENDDDSEEVRVDEDLKVHEVDIVEKDVLVTVNASEVDPLETGEDHEVFEKSERRKKLEKLKGDIEKVKQNLKEGDAKEVKKVKKNLKDNEEHSDDDLKEHKKLKKHRGSPSASAKKKSISPKKQADHQTSRHPFRPSPTPGARKFPGIQPGFEHGLQHGFQQSPPKIEESLETETEGVLQSVESKKPFPMWPEAVGGALEAARKARKEKLRQFRVMRALRRYNMPTETPNDEHEEEAHSALPTDEGKTENLESADPEKVKTDRCSQTDCKKKVGLTGFACRCQLVFCPLHRCKIYLYDSDTSFWIYQYKN